MFRVPLCASSGALEYHTSGFCLPYVVLGFQVVGTVGILFPHIIDDAWSKPHQIHTLCNLLGITNNALYDTVDISVPHSQNSIMEVTHIWHAGNSTTNF
jgi:hypothetical protein